MLLHQRHSGQQHQQPPLPTKIRPQLDLTLLAQTPRPVVQIHCQHRSRLDIHKLEVAHTEAIVRGGALEEGAPPFEPRPVARPGVVAAQEARAFQERPAIGSGSGVRGADRVTDGGGGAFEVRRAEDGALFVVAAAQGHVVGVGYEAEAGDFGVVRRRDVTGLVFVARVFYEEVAEEPFEDVEDRIFGDGRMWICFEGRGDRIYGSES